MNPEASMITALRTGTGPNESLGVIVFGSVDCVCEILMELVVLRAPEGREPLKDVVKRRIEY